jgi:hypothetical protein
MEVSVTTLFKQYGERCDNYLEKHRNHSVHFLDFGIDAKLGDSINGLVVVDIHQLIPIKDQIYLAGHLPEKILS